jgi:hypothetical protein
MEEKEIKEAMIEALTHLEGCKYFVATIVNNQGVNALWYKRKWID